MPSFPPPDAPVPKIAEEDDAGRVARVDHVQAARHLLHPHRFQESFRAAPPPALRHSVIVGVQAAITVLIALPLFYVSPWADYIGFAALGSLVALFGRFAPRKSRSMILLICGLCQISAVFLMSLLTWLGAPLALQLGLLALGCGLFLFLTLTGRFGPPGALIFVFALAAGMAPIESGQELFYRTGATALVALLAWLICLLSEPMRVSAKDEQPLPQEKLLPLGHRSIMAARAVIGAIFALGISSLWGAEHPAWAAMGALAVLQGAHLHMNFHRALQRMGGTAVGALLAWLLLVQDPSIWVMIGILAALQLVTEIVIGFNYALGQALVTPMALLMTHMASGEGDAAGMASERVWDTIVGVLVGISIAWLLSTLDDRRALADYSQSAKG